MPDLGDYAAEVLAAYAVSIALIVWIVAASVWRARRVRDELRQVEARRGREDA
jgi:heme exporter protein D